MEKSRMQKIREKLTDWLCVGSKSTSSLISRGRCYVV